MSNNIEPSINLIQILVDNLSLRDKSNVLKSLKIEYMLEIKNEIHRYRTEDEYFDSINYVSSITLFNFYNKANIAMGQYIESLAAHVKDIHVKYIINKDILEVINLV